MKRLIVCGSRHYDDRTTLERELSAILDETHHRDATLTIVHGACPSGADAMADRWAVNSKARSWKVEIERWPAEWGEFGKFAGPRRNLQMAQHGADLCLAFWDGQSTGTLDMIRKCIDHGIAVRIVPMRRMK